MRVFLLRNTLTQLAAAGAFVGRKWKVLSQGQDLLFINDSLIYTVQGISQLKWFLRSQKEFQFHILIFPRFKILCCIFQNICDIYLLCYVIVLCFGSLRGGDGKNERNHPQVERADVRPTVRGAEQTQGLFPLPTDPLARVCC